MEFIWLWPLGQIKEQLVDVTSHKLWGSFLTFYRPNYFSIYQKKSCRFLLYYNSCFHPNVSEILTKFWENCKEKGIKCFSHELLWHNYLKLVHLDTKSSHPAAQKRVRSLNVVQFWVKWKQIKPWTWCEDSEAGKRQRVFWTTVSGPWAWKKKASALNDFVHPKTTTTTTKIPFPMLTF